MTSRQPGRRTTHGVAITLAALAMAIAPLSAVPTSPSQASPPNPQGTHRTPDARESYVLPGNCVYPENVEVYGGKYYVGTLCGRMYRGDLREKQAKVFVTKGSDVRIVGGIEATATRLVVARAGSGQAQVYNRSSGKLIARFYNGHKDESIVNDVAVTPDGDAYLTEFIGSKLYRIPAKDLRRHRAQMQPLHVFLSFRGTAFPVQEGSANGIVATPDGRFLVVAHYGKSELYRVRLHDKRVTRIDLQGLRLSGPDGMVMNNADVLYVAEPGKGRIAEVRLSNRYTKGRIVSRTTNALFRCPTAVDFAGDRLLVANSQYCSDTTELPFTLTSIPIP
jgi:sugar lactone lactonase YvrE